MKKILFRLTVFLMIFSLTGCAKANLNKLASHGEKQFLEHDLVNYTDRIKSVDSSISFSYRFEYSPDYDYDEEEKYLKLKGTICEITSEKLDSYSDTRKKSEKATELKELLEEIYNKMFVIYTYETNFGTVDVLMEPPKFLSINTPAGNVYEYDCQYGSTSVELNGKNVYWERTETSSDSKTKCDRCNGTGTLKYYYGGSDLEAYLDGYDPYTYGQCGSCHGTGLR